MAIFDIEKDELLRLSDAQLEELIARLAEAEIAALGHSPAWVSWSGSINAPDGGIDIHVRVPADKLSTGFLERPDTILQAKKHSMPRASIKKEMLTGRRLSSTLAEQAKKGGSYIIVSLGDDCSPVMQKDRLKAMQDAVENDPNSGNIHLNFYDRSKLAQWLRQHPSIMLWVKDKLGQGYSGWQPYGAWSNPPQGAVDTFISAPGVTVTLPSGKGTKLNLEDAINPMRDLIRSTAKAVRITGLSGVGKTRIVQALFDETIGTGALDRTVVIYVDTGAEPTPSATAMLDRLIAEGRYAIMILDNCPSELHSLLASKVSTSGNKVSLVTIEYDIRDDKPQTTEVIHIEAIGPGVAEQLLLRRFPCIGQNNAHRIAEFADGNARVSLAIAERVEEGESLAQLSDAQLFNRLFEQRNHSDENLREQAEILSLVYSFSVSAPDMGYSELEVLGSLSGHTQNQLFRAVKNLLDRHIVQKRSHWRAILPHAIANKLASSALDSIPVEQLRATFEASGHQRLLMSFAHRLGLLHNHPVAKEIVKAWLQPNGLLGQITELDDMLARMLNYIGPVAPEALLNRLEEELTAPDFKYMEPSYDPRRRTVLNLLQLLAYEPNAFDRCVRLQARMADYEDEGTDNNLDTARNKIAKFFQAYLSGTHASLGQRIAFMNECLSSVVAGRRSLGFKILSTALDGPPWTGFGINEFGARPRDFGFQPTHNELVEWRSAFIDVAVQLGTSGNPELEAPARLLLADKFPGIWYQEAMRDKLIDAAHQLNAYSPWGEGWKAVRSIIYFDYTRQKDEDDLDPLPDNLAALERELKPDDLIAKIMTYVLSNGADLWELDVDFCHDDTTAYSESVKRLESKAFLLGENLAASGHELRELGPNLFSYGGMPYRVAFGRGLAKGACNLRVGWQQLVEQVEVQSEINKDFAVFAGFIEEVDSIDPVLAQELLDQCSQHPELRQVLVGLHPRQKFTDSDLDRCMALLDAPDIRPFMYGPILWKEQYAHLPKGRVLDLAQRLLKKPNGDDVILEALSLRLHNKDKAVDTLGCDLRQTGLKAATLRFYRNDSDRGGSTDYKMERVVDAALRFGGNEVEKQLWLDTIFSVVDKHYGYINTFENTIGTTAALVPEAFLNRIFEGSEEQQQRRLFFIRHGGLRRLPLSKINADVLIEWCRNKSDPGAWSTIASGIGLWPKNMNQQDGINLWDAALRFLENSPEPKAVLESFSEQVRPSSWSGSLANVMQSRADVIGKLVEHERTDISGAARAVYAELTKLIEREKVREQREDEEREQRFE
ncbi:hypothetical protein LV724_001788 [Salmonella enterica]|uniref:hypothetical protein n=1 Tax=Salmonella TaxID=590 RepID=UPI001270F0CD|nr:hypothetical protein [Salmonella enterica subsp. enterica serovar Agona]EDA5312360.1 hypothetical protein [Salmonella enterica]EFQ2768292.1 hypothetical protein [Salmonella enterica subsp. enterica serovar Agona]EFS6317412.1 hypothetical protein [Salmonella enterica subsp. enterica serovar Agona]EFT4433764.1 hypothetical protein [Salmonella enterica subsp. enterica serovar Agona]